MDAWERSLGSKWAVVWFAVLEGEELGVLMVGLMGMTVMGEQ